MLLDRKDKVERTPLYQPDLPVRLQSDCVTIAFSAGGNSARFDMVLKDMGFITVHLRVAACGETSEAGADDDCGFSGHFSHSFL